MKVCIDPDAGGATIVSGGHPPTILAAGYVGSTILGGLFIMAGFDTLVSKIMSFVIGIGLVAPLALVRNKLYVPLPLPPRCAGTSSDRAIDAYIRILGFSRAFCHVEPRRFSPVTLPSSRAPMSDFVAQPELSYSR